MPDLVPAYIAHQLGAGPDRERNRQSAARWVGWLSERYYIEPVCPWIVLASIWPETMRERGLEIDRAAIERCGLLIACGPSLSAGMRMEMSWARDWADITGFGIDDKWQIDEVLSWVLIRRRING